MRPCINEATTMTTDFETDMRAYAKAGFNAVELWLSTVIEYVESQGIDQARRLMDRLGLEPVCACAQGGLMLAEGEDRAETLAEFERRLELCQALGVPKMVAYAGRSAKPTPELYKRMVDNIGEVADMAAGYGLTLALEFIKGHPVLGCMATCVELVRRADCANVGVLFDTFHFMAGVSKMSDLEALSPEALTFVHLNDAPALPREALTDADRIWPGQGCFPIAAFREHLLRLGYSDGVSIELFSRELWDRDPYAVASEAYKHVSAFIDGRLGEA